MRCLLVSSNYRLYHAMPPRLLELSTAIAETLNQQLDAQAARCIHARSRLDGAILAVRAD